METIGSRIKYARLRRGYSQEELAQGVGLRQQTIQWIEADKTKRSRYLPEIAQFLRVRWEWLLHGTGPMDKVGFRGRRGRRRGDRTQDFSRYLD